MDNLEPITRNEMLLNGDDLEPITREEMILVGEDLEPITRHEWFLKKYRGGGGGGEYDLVNVPNLPADIASFNDGTDLPMASLKVAVTPYQDLHGYDAPWAGGAGKNKLQITATTQTLNGVTFTVNSDGTVNLSGTATGTFVFPLISGTLSFSSDTIITGGYAEASASKVALRVNGSNLVPSEGYTISANTNITEIAIRVNSGFNTNGVKLYPMIRLSSVTESTYAPYSNICPIIGWDEAVVTVADDAESPTTSHEYTIDLDGTRYGGVVDATNGTMDDTLDHIASYNGEALPSTWISDRDVYAEGTTPTIGAEVVYTRATPITVQLAPTPVKSLEGENNISANCGQITEVKYFKKA